MQPILNPRIIECYDVSNRIEKLVGNYKLAENRALRLALSMGTEMRRYLAISAKDAANNLKIPINEFGIDLRSRVSSVESVGFTPRALHECYIAIAHLWSLSADEKALEAAMRLSHFFGHIPPPIGMANKADAYVSELLRNLEDEIYLVQPVFDEATWYVGSN